MDKTNHRPVTILPPIRKVFEKSVFPQLTAHFEAIFSGSLTAYPMQHSCFSTLLRLTEDWKGDLVHNNIIGTVLIDLSKAFDRLPNLFNIFVSDLIYNVKKTKLSAYADDVQPETHKG